MINPRVELIETGMDIVLYGTDIALFVELTALYGVGEGEAGIEGLL
ncbi:hypothetical protein JCM19231_3740 [Vibrio ishigakensis]|uniref:Uncharacterized protein n=1 Tax=Vibrio ishigakensis TaxID=1481914 RepID=A0A0B8NQQ4_9VIBR|nr:hypothetical protein JCM19231_3740 [Vibrio ishigakensis]